jgi:hypothetical protein
MAMYYRREVPPEPWVAPCQITERTLFQRPVNEVLADARVSRDETRRWKELLWISFDIDAIAELDDPEFNELCFVRNIARSGINEELIAEMLAELPKPYAYLPLHTAFNFALGWVQAPSVPDENELIDQHLHQWIEETLADGEHDKLVALMGFLQERPASARPPRPGAVPG